MVLLAILEIQEPTALLEMQVDSELVVMAVVARTRAPRPEVQAMLELQMEMEQAAALAAMVAPVAMLAAMAALEVLAAHDEDSRQKRLSVRCPDDMIAQLFKKGRP